MKGFSFMSRIFMLMKRHISFMIIIDYINMLILKGFFTMSDLILLSLVKVGVTLKVYFFRHAYFRAMLILRCHSFWEMLIFETVLIIENLRYSLYGMLQPKCENSLN